MPKPDVLVVGRSCLDHIAVVERLPEEDTKIAMEFRMVEAGGQGGTAACCIAGLGGNVAYVGRVGDDDAGRLCIQRLNDFGVDTSHVRMTTGGKTPIAYIFVTKNSGSRTIVYEPNRLPKITETDIPADWIEDAAVLLLDPEVTYLAKAPIGKRAGKPVIVYDCERWREGLEAMMDVADFFIPSSDFLKSGEFGPFDLSNPKPLLKLKNSVKGGLIVTCGAEGAVIVERNRLIYVPAPVVPVKDTIGAGDNFHAAFSLAVSRKRSVIESVKFAVSTASLSCKDYGGKAGIPTWEKAWRDSVRLTEKIVSIC